MTRLATNAVHRFTATEPAVLGQFQTVEKMSSSSLRPACAARPPRLVADHVDDLVDCQSSDQPPAASTPERKPGHTARRPVAASPPSSIGESVKQVAFITAVTSVSGSLSNSRFQRQRAFQHFRCGDDEHLVGMVRQLIEATQVAQHDSKRHVLAES